ncbi:carboxymuconolactone decarboxylase family protein [Nonomuraea sp. NPDC059194]|uniref:carboxymuconolactone decarboxylase family protein n=1 Tax=Nonomuraea sp. NPDC059194 TaxID=3346764 RepID=UPI00367E5AF5
MSAPRIAPGGLADVGCRTWLFSAAAGRVARTAPPNLFLTLGRHRPLFRGWLRFAGRLMPGGKLPRHDTELVILRVAHLRGCAYEFEHHRRLGRRAGVDPDRVRQGQASGGWSRRDRLVLAAVDQLHVACDLDDELWGELHAELGDAGMIELVMLVGHYEMLATFIGTLRIAPDAQRSIRD